MKNKHTIAIITYHRSYNYGATLQAIATVEYFHRLGYDVKIIDYFPLNLRSFGTFKNSFSDVSVVNGNLFIRFAKALLKTPGYKKLKKKFDVFVDRELPLTKPYYSYQALIDNPPVADIYCSGSDQVWNNYFTKTFDDAYFLGFCDDSNIKIAFASSFGKDNFNDEEMSYLRKKLSRYDYISVREFSGIGIVNKLELKNCDLILDPTLMVVSDFWNNFADVKRFPYKYILVYQIHGDSDTFDSAVAVAKIRHMKIVKICTMPHQRKMNSTNIMLPGIREFIGLFLGADCVFTDSFHGVIFSTLFNKKLWISMPSKFSDRINTLIKQINAQNFVVNDVEKWLNIDYEKEYAVINQRLNFLREENNIKFKTHLSLIDNIYDL